MKEIYEKSDLEIINIGKVDIFNIVTSSPSEEETTTTAGGSEVVQGEGEF